MAYLQIKHVEYAFLPVVRQAILFHSSSFNPLRFFLRRGIFLPAAFVNVYAKSSTALSKIRYAAKASARKREAKA